jgi:hypothetical protein
MADTAFFLLRLNDHMQYLRKIQATLDDQGDFLGTDYRECKLGRWLYSDGPAAAAALGPVAQALFDSILGPHQRFHEASSLALERKRALELEGMRLAITEMLKLSAMLVDKLLTLDQMTRERST